YKHDEDVAKVVQAFADEVCQGAKRANQMKPLIDKARGVGEKYKTWGLPLCRTGSPAETLIVVVVVCGIGWHLWHNAGGALPARILHWQQRAAQGTTRPDRACPQVPREAQRAGGPPRG
ncbi:MAG: hypothetical protein ACJ8AW_50565, partial [Rhodopila sp.]